MQKEENKGMRDSSPSSSLLRVWAPLKKQKRRERE